MENKEIDFPSRISPSQEKLLFDVLRSSYLTKKTRDLICNVIKKKGLTVREAIFSIDLVLAESKFRKYVLGKRSRSLAKCMHCGNRFNLTSWKEPNKNVNYWECDDCKVLKTNELSEDLTLVKHG